MIKFIYNEDNNLTPSTIVNIVDKFSLSSQESSASYKRLHQRFTKCGKNNVFNFSIYKYFTGVRTGLQYAIL